MHTVTADNLPRLMNCNGSRKMPEAFPSIDASNAQRDEGNAAHWLAHELFAGRVADDAAVGSKAPNGVIITATMFDHVQSYLGALDCGEMEATTSFGADAWRVNGRCDHWKYVQSAEDQMLGQGALVVDDFKYGWSIIEPERNWTLIAHAVGLCIFHRITPLTIVLRIHQPRPYHPDGPLREWRITYDDLMLYYGEIAATMANPSDALVTGLSWCRRCHALANCPAAREARMNAIDASTIAFTDTLPDDALAHELDTMRMAKATVEAQLDALEELAMYRLGNGAKVGNYAAEPQYAHRRWKAGITADALTIASGIDCRLPANAITPAEAERRKMPAALVALLTERPMTGVKLKRIDPDKHARRLLGKR